MTVVAHMRLVPGGRGVAARELTVRVWRIGRRDVAGRTRRRRHVARSRCIAHGGARVAVVLIRNHLFRNGERQHRAQEQRSETTQVDAERVHWTVWSTLQWERPQVK